MKKILKKIWSDTKQILFTIYKYTIKLLIDKLMKFLLKKTGISDEKEQR